MSNKQTFSARTTESKFKNEPAENYDRDRTLFIEKIMSTYLRHNLSFPGLEDVMELLNDNRETCDKFPTCKKSILEMFHDKRDLFDVFKFVKCGKCQKITKIDSHVHKSNCVRCNAAIKTTETNFFIGIPIEQQIKKSVRENWSYISKFDTSGDDNSQSYSDAHDGKILKDLLKQYAESDVNILSLCLNLDGANKYKSSVLSVWPIQLVQNYLPPSIRFLPHNIIVAGLYYHQKKPDCFEYMLPLVNELIELSQRKITMDIDGEEFVFKPAITHCSVDLPAKSLLQAIKQYGGYESCTYCDIVGESIVIGKTSDCDDDKTRKTQKTRKKNQNIKTDTIPVKKESKFVRYTEGSQQCAMRDEFETLEAMLAASTSTSGEAVNGVKGKILLFL